MSASIRNIALCARVASQQRRIATRTTLRRVQQYNQPVQRRDTSTSFSQLKHSIKERIRKWRDYLEGNNDTTPKGVAERELCYNILITIEHRASRLEDDSKSHTREDHMNYALQHLESLDLDYLSNVHLRKLIHDKLEEQAQNILTTFRDVDKILNIPIYDEPLDREKCIGLLRDDYDKTMAVADSSSCSSNSKAYFQVKKEAYDIIFEHFKNKPIYETTTTSRLDAFGNDMSKINPIHTPRLRINQLINLTRSVMIKERLGYSVVCLRSLIPNAGRGLFLDGSAMSGSIVAFHPGPVWPNDFIHKNLDMAQDHFSQDKNHQTFARHDDFVIDSRNVPVSELSKSGSLNPWALGHMINHCPANQKPNIRNCPLNYTKKSCGPDMEYIPNTYVNPPGWSGQLMDMESFLMHGLCVINHTDLENEEVLDDYKLEKGVDNTSLPSWYVPLQQTTQEQDADEDIETGKRRKQ